jgi:integrase
MERVSNPAPRRLTQRYVERLRPWTNRAYAVRDAEVKGLMVVVQPSGRLSWHVQADAYEELSDGRLRLLGTRRKKIGEPALMDVSVARTRARDLLAQLRRPRPASAQDLTLAEAWALYVAERRRKGRAPRTIANLEDILRVYLQEWADRPLADVFADRLGVVRLHERLTKRGPVQANRVFRALRAVLRRAHRLDPSLPAPPTEAVEQNPERRRSDRAPDAEQLREWWAAVQRLGSPVRRDAHLLSLLTGLRTGSDGARGGGVGVVSLRWEHVDFDQRLLRLPTTKTRPLIVPLCRRAIEVLERRRRDNVTSPHVFPAASKTGHMHSLRESRLSHCGHDMRAAYITHAEVAGVPRELIKRLVGHADNSTTGGYVNPAAQIEFLRSAQQLISDHLWSHLRAQG